MNYLLLIKTLINAIKAVETLMPDSKGKEKFDAAVALVEGVMGEVSAIVPQLMPIATLIVEGLRVKGIFKAKTPAVA